MMQIISEYKKRTFLAKSAWLFIVMISKSLKIKFEGFEKVRRLHSQEKQLVFTIWHGHLFGLIHIMPFRYNLSMLVSTSKDGQLLSIALKKSGYNIIPGSSHREPAKSLKRLVQTINNKSNLIITVDGPTGPIHQVKRGAVFTAQKTQSHIVPVAFLANRKITLRSWDKSFIPLPFTKCSMIFGDPYLIREDADIFEECAHLKGKLDGLQ